MSSRAVGIDIGGTKILGLAVDPSAPGDVAEQVRVPTPAGEHEILEAIIVVAERLGRGPTEPVGIGVAGLVDRDGAVRTSPNLPGIREFALQERLRDRLGPLVAVDNDATTAALAEVRAGGLDADGTALFITLGTGVGGGVVVDGRVHRGANGFAGEFGHMIVDPGGVRCVCGRNGCWERYASGSALERMARDRFDEVEFTETDREDITGEVVIEEARRGNSDALAVLDVFAGWVGLGIGNLVTAFDPQQVILGGGVLDSADVLLDRIRSGVRESVFGGAHRPEIEVTVATLGSRAGAVGAALMAAEMGS